MDSGLVYKIIDDKKVLIKVKSLEECSSCEKAHSCFLKANKDSLIEAFYDSDIKEGDVVQIILEPKIRILSSILLFFIPVLFTFIFYLVSEKLFKNENISILFSIGGLILSFFLLIMILKNNKITNKFIPSIKKIDSFNNEVK